MARTKTRRNGPSLGWVFWPAAVLVALMSSVAAFVDPAPDTAGVRPEPRPPAYHSDERSKRLRA